mgnify:CR=1 FL=1
MDDQIRTEVQKILEEIQPALALHRGGAELASVQDGRVEIKLKGACHGCEMSAFTFGMMVDAEIKKRVPEVKEIVYN